MSSKKTKNMALVAHDSKKNDLINWAVKNKEKLESLNLSATGTTGAKLEKALGREVQKFASGPLGGDMEIGTGIVRGEIDLLIFFWDPLESMPHDPDIKALLRVATMWNVPLACNETSANYLISSPLFDQNDTRNLSTIEEYKKKRV